MTEANESTIDTRQLSEKPLGYALSAGGGILGGPLGLIISPLVLLILNNAMKPIGDKKPNRFRAWALIGIIGAPLSLGIFGAMVSNTDVSTTSTTKETIYADKSPSSAPPAKPVPSKQPQQAKAKSIKVGKFVLSDISVKPYRGKTSNADVAGELWVASGNVTNNGNETAVPAYSMSLSVQDAQGRSFKEADMTVTMNAIIDESFGGKKVLRMTDGVLPGSTRSNVQLGVFDVSPGAEGLRLCAGSMFGGKKCM